MSVVIWGVGEFLGLGVWRTDLGSRSRLRGGDRVGSKARTWSVGFSVSMLLGWYLSFLVSRSLLRCLSLSVSQILNLSLDL